MSSSSHLIRSTERSLVTESDQTASYQGTITTNWNLSGIPNGGYTLATVLNCAQNFVERKRGKANAYLLLSSVNYINKAQAQQIYTVDVRTLKSGNGTTNVEADLLQPDRSGNLQLKLRVELIFANFDELRIDGGKTDRFTLDGTNGSVAQFPFLTDPDQLGISKVPWLTTPSYPVVKVDDEAVQAAFEKGQHISPMYVYMRQEDVEEENVARYNITAMAMYCDMTALPWMMIPESALGPGGDLLDFKMATLSLTIEMREPMPKFALQRVASIARTQHLKQGQWRLEVEVWSHPNDAERFGLPIGTKSILLAVSHQTAIFVSRPDRKTTKTSKM